MDVSIIILNYKSCGLTRQALKHLTESNWNITTEIIVVDNNSHENCIKKITKQFPAVIPVTLTKNMGYAAGNNRGIARASGKALLLINPDVAVTRDGVEKLYHFLMTKKDAGICAPRLVNPNGTMQYSCFRWPRLFTPFYRRTLLGKLSFGKKEIRRYVMLDFNHQETRSVDWVLGGCVMVKREAIETVGMLDERFFLYMEDVDWCRRFWENGYAVYYYSGVTMVHFHQRQSAGGGLSLLSNKPLYAHIMSWLKYHIKYFGKAFPRR